MKSITFLIYTTNVLNSDCFRGGRLKVCHRIDLIYTVASFLLTIIKKKVLPINIKLLPTYSNLSLYKNNKKNNLLKLQVYFQNFYP